MKNRASAFTLIELLVVITIIAILASIALPVFNGVTERANQTKDLSNAKQIGLALKLFATDNNGDFPSKAPSSDYSTAAPLATGSYSNQAYWWLFPNYLQSESIFTVPGSQWGKAADDVIDPANAGTQTNTLKAGENNYAYVGGLTDTSNPSFPLIADGFTTTVGTYSTNKGVKGGIWAGKKAVVVFCDFSGQIMKVDPTSLQVKRPGHTYSMFDTGSSTTNDPWLDASSNYVLNPN